MARHLLTPAGQGDDGAADEALVRVLAAGGPTGRVDPAALTAALRRARVFVAIEAMLTSADATTGADKTSEMALATLRTPSGATALPIFSSVATLAAWRGAARPVPVAAPDAWAEAVRLGLDSVVIDVAGPYSTSLEVGHGGADVPVGPDAVGDAWRADRAAAVDERAAAVDRSRVADGGVDAPVGVGRPDPSADTTLTALRRPANPDGPLARARVRVALRAITERVEAWPAELVEPGAAAPRPVLAVAVHGPAGDTSAAGESIARHLSQLLGAVPDPGGAAPTDAANAVDRCGGPGPEPLGAGAGAGAGAGSGAGAGAGAVAVLVVGASEARAVRRLLGRGLRAERGWASRLRR
ncbi:SseB family protein [Frankia sp. AvcI1]|uniref:SseB family protein n=1 Tax=Frankia sp. AvcI1 TaxID=573496 RepID=UPI0006EC2955|nr:SseB family protein [Frankia sp. AvcI1]